MSSEAEEPTEDRPPGPASTQDTSASPNARPREEGDEAEQREHAPERAATSQRPTVEAQAFDHAEAQAGGPEEDASADTQPSGETAAEPGGGQAQDRPTVPAPSLEPQLLEALLSGEHTGLEEARFRSTTSPPPPGPDDPAQGASPTRQDPDEERRELEARLASPLPPELFDADFDALLEQLRPMDETEPGDEPEVQVAALEDAELLAEIEHLEAQQAQDAGAATRAAEPEVVEQSDRPTMQAPSDLPAALLPAVLPPDARVPSPLPPATAWPVTVPASRSDTRETVAPEPSDAMPPATGGETATQRVWAWMEELQREASESRSIAVAASDLPSRRGDESRLRSARELDPGAEAAQRTVFEPTLRTRATWLPLAGTGRISNRARAGLLEHLAERSSGAARARLLVAATDLAHQAGDDQAAHKLGQGALEADSTNLVALRNARRHAVARGDWTRALELLSSEAELELPAAERAQALALLAEMHLRVSRALSEAGLAAQSALELDPSNVAAGLLLAEVRLREKDGPAAAQALARVAECVADQELAAALRLEAGRLLDQAGEQEQASELFHLAGANGNNIEACLRLARSARLAGEIELACQALTRTAVAVSAEPLKEALQRLAARWLAEKEPEQALDRLGPYSGHPTARLRARIAQRSKDVNVQARALLQWAETSGTTERALALAEAARVHAAAERWLEATTLLGNAASADPTLATVPVIQRALAKGSGDGRRMSEALSRTGQPGTKGVLAAAAKLSLQGKALAKERQMLARASLEGGAPVTEVLSLDLAAHVADTDLVQDSLRRTAAKAAPEHRLGAHLAWLDFVAGGERSEQARRILAASHDAAPGSPTVLRHMMRMTDDARQLAQLWIEEASVSHGDHAAFAATMAARYLLESNQDPMPQYRRALELAQGYEPAAWALDALARGQRAQSWLPGILEQLADSALDPWDRAVWLIRAARAGAPERSMPRLRRAFEVWPDDPLLFELLSGPDGLDEATLAAHFERRGEQGGDELSQAARLQAASAYEEAGEPGRAAELYRQVLEHGSEAMRAHALLAIERVELSAGQHERVAERLRGKMEAAEEPEIRDAWLARLIAFEAHARPASYQNLSRLEALRADAPESIPLLRALERHYMDAGNCTELQRVEATLAGHLRSAGDAASHLQLALQLARSPAREGATRAAVPEQEATPSQEAATRLLLGAPRKALTDLWLVHQLEAAARQRGDTAALARALRQALDLFPLATERTSIALRLAAVLEEGAAEEAAAIVERTVGKAPQHPVAHEELGRLWELAGRPKEAATAFEQAGSASWIARRRARLWYRAGVLWQDTLQEPERALRAFRSVFDADPLYRDVFDRTKSLLRETGDASALAALYERRLKEGGDPLVLAELHSDLAQLWTRSGERERAKQTLLQSLRIEPARLATLRALSGLYLEDREWVHAADVLIRVARITRDNSELVRVFKTLGEIYCDHLPDPKRAEMAYTRAVQLAREDTDAITRLEQLYQRTGALDKAVRALRRLLELSREEEHQRELHHSLANTLQRLGDADEVEATLRRALRRWPTDRALIASLSELYVQQNASQALTIHLDRASHAFREALAKEPERTELWDGLAETLTLRSRETGVRSVASAAVAVGAASEELAAHVDANGSAGELTMPRFALDQEALVCPKGLTEAMRSVFRVGQGALEALLPIGPEDYQTYSLSLMDNPARDVFRRVSRWFELGEISVYATPTARAVCLPLGTWPPTVIVGDRLLKSQDQRAQEFLLARAVSLARASLHAAVTHTAEQLQTALHTLRAYCDDGYDREDVALVPRDKLPEPLVSLPSDTAQALLPALQQAIVPELDPERLRLDACGLANRIALLMTGDCQAALAALVGLTGAAWPEGSQARTAAIANSQEARELFEFAYSNAFVRAREQAEQAANGAT